MMEQDALTTTLTIFSAMLTPVILISASGSLTISTSTRLNRAIDRARKLSEIIEQLVNIEQGGALFEERRTLVFNQLLQITRRARLLHRSLTFLYLAMGIFIATSFSLGIVATVHSSHTEVPLLFGFVGLCLLFGSILMLVMEASIARQAIDAEMNFALHVGAQYAPTDLAGTFKTPHRSWFFSRRHQEG